MTSAHSGTAMISCQQCGKPTKVPKDVMHKKFCSAKCRQTWHLLRRKQAMQLLAEKEGGEA